MGDEFVIQIHSGYGPLHYDLMLRRGEALATWQLGQSPAEIDEGGQVPARKLPDHRLAYLTHEGPVSGGRGQVTILDRGTYRLLACREGHWQFRLRGGRLRGMFKLDRAAADVDDWVLRHLPEG